jgi:DNA mismatch repair protein MutS
LFAATPTQTAPVASEANKLEQMLNEILPDELTPREALQKLYELKEALK